MGLPVPLVSTCTGRSGPELNRCFHLKDHILRLASLACRRISFKSHAIHLAIYIHLPRQLPNLPEPENTILMNVYF